MSVRTNAVNEYSTATFSAGSQTQISVCGWMRLSSDRNTNTTFVSIGSGTGDYWSLATDTNGTSMRFYDDTANFGSFAMTVGTWYFVAASTNGTNGSLWVTALGSNFATPVTWTTGASSVTATTMLIGEHHLGSMWLDGGITAVKVWFGQTLTEADFIQERFQNMPKNTTGLKAWYPFIKPETTDYSGNGFTLTGQANTNQESDPGLPWGSQNNDVVRRARNAFLLNLTESEGLADASTLAQTLPVSITDSEGLTDARTFAQTMPLSVTDSEGLTDARTLAQTMPLSISDPLGETDVLAFGSNLDLADNEGLTDSRTFAQTMPFSKSEAMGLTDSMALYDPTALPLTETLGMADTANVALSMAKSLTDGLGTTDFISLILGYWEGEHVPHSGPGYGEIYIDRFFLVEKEKATETTDGKMSIAGQESSPPTTVGLVTFLHGQVAGLQEGKLVPVVFRDKAERNAYYNIGQASSELTDYQGEVATADWQIELQRMGSDSEIDLQSRLTGAVRQNDFSLTGQKWHSPAVGHYGYHTGSTAPTSVTRSTVDGNITVYLGIPDNIHPKWGCPVNMYHGGRVRILDTREVTFENEIEGLNRNISSSGWNMTNGILNVTPQATGGVLNVSYWDGSAWQTNYWKVQVAGVNVQQWSAATIIRNDFEQCVIRLTAIANGGRTTLDLGLRRGSRFIEGYLQNSASATLKVAPNNTTASTSGTGYQIASAGTHRAACGSARTFTVDNTNGGISKASVLAFDFWIGVVINAAAPATGDAVTDLRNQYIGSMPEYTYGVRR